MPDNITLENPLLSKIQLPGRIFSLPSGGIFYTDGELSEDVKNGEIHVHPMSAIAEINLKNPDMLFSGKAIEKVFKECVPEIKKPAELYGKDVDAIMCFLRVVTYGPSYEVSAKHNCENGKEHSYEINLEEIIATSKTLDPTILEQQYTVRLNNGQTVILEPIRFKHIIQMLQSMDKDNKKLSAEEIQDGLIKNTLNTIKSVDNITDKAMIEGWLRMIISPMMNKIAEAIDKSNDWGLDYVRKVKCRDCEKEFNLEIPMNPISFFSE